VKALAERLSEIPWIDREETPYDEPPSWTLAMSYSDIEASCQKLLGLRFPALIQATSPEELSDVLLEIRLDLQHIVWHLATTPALRELIDDAPALSGDE